MRLRALLVAAALAAGLTLPAIAAAPDPAILATINGVNDALNSNNVSKLGSYYTSSPVIIDEFAPYTWTGANAPATWWTGFGKLSTKMKFSDIRSVIGTVKFSNVTGNSAYAVVPLQLHYRANGKAQLETGVLALTLKRQGSTWKVATQSWATLSNTMM